MLRMGLIEVWHSVRTHHDVMSWSYFLLNVQLPQNGGEWDFTTTKYPKHPKRPFDTPWLPGPQTDLYAAARSIQSTEWWIDEYPTRVIYIHTATHLIRPADIWCVEDEQERTGDFMQFEQSLTRDGAKTLQFPCRNFRGFLEYVWYMFFFFVTYTDRSK